MCLIRVGQSLDTIKTQGYLVLVLCRNGHRHIRPAEYRVLVIVVMDRSGIFAGEDPFTLAREWLSEATKTELNDPNAIALATVDAFGMPNVRIVLLKDIEKEAFVFYTNYESVKAQELETAGLAAFAMHWKSLGRQIRVRGKVERVDAATSDAYYQSRSLQSRIGAWVSRQSQPIATRDALMSEVEKMAAEKGENPARPPHWGGFRIQPLEIEFWCDGPSRLHDRFKWERSSFNDRWEIHRLSP